MRPTAEQVREALDYNRETGEFVWLRTLSVRAPAGKRAGSYRLRGYRSISLWGKSYYEHRLAWLLVTGEWPEDEVDHINGVGTDNRWVNLRAASRAQNGRNKRLPRNNTSGFKGVTFCHRDRLWLAQLEVAGKHYFLGRHRTPEKAHAAYLAAARKYYGEFARAG